MPASEWGLSCGPVAEWLEPFSQVFWSPRDLCGWGESAGVIARFSPRERPLLSVSVVEVAELDMRLES